LVLLAQAIEATLQRPLCAAQAQACAIACTNSARTAPAHLLAPDERLLSFLDAATLDRLRLH
jgi:hypothetical protein